jgi:hypothetical protein
MTLGEAPKISAQPGENSADQVEESLADKQVMASVEDALMHGTESNCESQSGDFRDSKTASDNSRRLKVAAAATLARISYNFGQSTVRKTCLTSMESYAHYFPKGYRRPPGAEYVPEPRANEVVVFEDFFAAGLRMPPHPILVYILRKF